MAERDEKGRFVKGVIPWCKGLTKNTDKRIMKIAKSKTGKNYYNWKGGKTRHPSGAIRVSENGRQFWEHHQIWCTHNNMLIIPHGCEVHHRDLNPANNNPDKIILLPTGSHRQLHYQIQLRDNPDRIYFGKNNELRGDIYGC